MTIKTDKLITGFIKENIKNYEISNLEKIVNKYYIENVKFIREMDCIKLDKNAKRGIIVYRQETEPAIPTHCSNFVSGKMGNLIHKWTIKANKVPKRQWLMSDIYFPYRPQIQFFIQTYKPKINSVGWNMEIGGMENQYTEEHDEEYYYHDDCYQYNRYNLETIEEELTEEETTENIKFVNEKGEIVEPIKTGDIIEIYFAFKTSGSISVWININGKRNGIKTKLPKTMIKSDIEYTPGWWSKTKNVTLTIVDYCTMRSP